ncbi:MAG: hypothetical protein EZS28_000581 [Streblomastix strix]|uniref:Uncharacterized protein n=1 Tax=Streblomastix strix TaxID=222440 RepID=A0A5J4X9S4_9EUKA|nr:MAG: hypothetical protein EZS28_000581 [Streblomastix strix]
MAENVLDQKKYMNILRNVIERDFFPDLKTLRSQTIEGIGDIEGQTLQQKEEINKTKAHLDTIHEHITAEDTDSFRELMDDQSERFRQQRWLTDGNQTQKDNSTAIILRSENSSAIVLRSEQPIHINSTSTSSTSSIPPTLAMAITSTSVSLPPGDQQLDPQEQMGPPSIVRRQNTRFKRDNLTGDEITSIIESNNQLIKTNDPINEEEQVGGPGVNWGWGGVTPNIGSNVSDLQINTPAPSPGRLAQGGVTPFITWGSVGSTPKLINTGSEELGLQIGAGVADERIFRMPPTPAREEGAHAIADKMRAALAVRVTRSQSTPSQIAMKKKQGHISLNQITSLTPRMSGAANMQTPRAMAPQTPRQQLLAMSPAARNFALRNTALGRNNSSSYMSNSKVIVKGGGGILKKK